MKIYREIILLSLVLGSIRCEFSQAYVDKILEAGSQETKRTDNDVAQSKQFTIATFNCDQMEASKQKPTSVHALRPADIELVAAIGDSLTAANGAKARSILGLLEENRGVSWSIGSEYPDVSLSITLPNILKKFNPLLYGASTGTGKVNTSVAYLNVAQPGHTSYEMWGQAYLLVARMREMPLFREYWKIVTFFVGGNDLCQSCGEEGKFSVANYTKNIRETLDYFQNNLPKTLVNLVLTLDVTGIEMLPGATCRNMQSSYCSCGLSQSFRPTLNNLTASYQKSIEDLIASGRYDTKEDFTVVLQPFMKKMKPPTTVFGTPDYTYFAPDCFHLSAKGHQAAAIELWNSMLTPVGKKKELWTLNSGIKCPTENQPFIFTNKNSQ